MLGTESWGTSGRPGNVGEGELVGYRDCWWLTGEEAG